MISGRGRTIAGKFLVESYLGGGAMHTAFARYRYSDYLATVTAMNLSGRVALREQYQSARAPG